MKLKFIITGIVFFIYHISFSQNIRHLDPPNWWVGMKDSSLQLLIHGEKISEYHVTINYPGVSVYQISKVENPNYLFVDLIIKDDTKPGMMNLEFSADKKYFVQSYELKQREKRKMDYGLDQSDFIYLLMPDRFSNGDTTNDVNYSMRDTLHNRKVLTDRHGGDLKGIINHLDYIKNLGATAVWCTPLLENDQPSWSYHGYAATDNYKIDARIGTNELYKQYAEKSHALGLKVVMDIVHNHVGLEHWFIRDLPMHDWINQWDEFTRTNYRTFTLMDNYASEFDKERMSNGWFDKHMPDLNQRNKFLAKYIIQNNIWWIEFLHVDGFRLDTY
ncbi:MAG: cyclomaltodextrinase N-terminal domain-containing protein, partial [Chitinophagales bacterium]|nr:cyclomaltodextrinase N-terminal domain-containing protein [Chitinophagales bacterium]